MNTLVVLNKSSNFSLVIKYGNHKFNIYEVEKLYEVRIDKKLNITESTVDYSFKRFFCIVDHHIPYKNNSIFNILGKTKNLNSNLKNISKNTKLIMFLMKANIVTNDLSNYLYYNQEYQIDVDYLFKSKGNYSTREDIERLFMKCVRVTNMHETMYYEGRIDLNTYIHLNSIL